MTAILRSRRRRRSLAVVAAVALAVAGCSGEEDAVTPLEAAQAEVT